MVVGVGGMGGMRGMVKVMDLRPKSAAIANRTGGGFIMLLV